MSEDKEEPSQSHRPLTPPQSEDGLDGDTRESKTTSVNWPIVPLAVEPKASPSVVEGPQRKHRLLVIGAVVLVLLVGLLGGVMGGSLVSTSSSSSLTISQSNTSPGAAILPSGLAIPRLVKQTLPSVVSIDVKSNGIEEQGTGMIISSNGMVITNNHVIAAATGGGAITITQSGSTKSEPAKLVGAIPADDVALLQIQGASDLPFVTFGNSNKIQVGDAVVAIGNALGLAAGTPTVTQGIISALGRTVTAGDGINSATETLTNMIQTDAAINPGNSGGPLLDSSGSVIGMNTAVAGSSGTGSNAQNIGFAIPSSTIEQLLPQLQKGGTAPTQAAGGYMGVQITTLTPDLQAQYKLTPTTGSVILSVVPGSPANTAGLRQGEVIVKINNKKIVMASEVTQITQSSPPGTVLKVVVYQGSTQKTVSVTLGTPPS